MAKVRNTARRKLAIASWDRPREGNIYGKLTLDADAALRYLDEVTERTGEKVTITHLVGVCVARALAIEPSLNGYLRFGRFHEHDDVMVTYLVAATDGSDLMKARIDDAHHKSVAATASELRERAGRLRRGEDEEYEASLQLIQTLPTQLLRPVVRFVGWLASSQGRSVPQAGIEAFPFGSAIVTSVGMFGLDEGFVPPTPFARVPVYVLIGAVRDGVTVDESGAVVVRRQLTITATIDHRFIDGFQGGVLAREFRRVFEDPWLLDAP